MFTNQEKIRIRAYRLEMKGIESIDQIIQNLTHQVIKNINKVRIFPLNGIIKGTEVLIFFPFR